MSETISNLEIMFLNSQSPPLTHTEEFDAALDDMISIFDTLFNFACTLSGFQFIGIIFDKSTLSDDNLIVEISYFFLGLGFIFSLFAAFLSYVALHFLKTIRFENYTFIETSIKKYKPIFYVAYITLFINSGFFLIPINIIVHDFLRNYFAITINVISFIIFIVGIIIYYRVIQRQQIFKINDNDSIMRTVFSQV